jgi:hypothetical protein
VLTDDDWESLLDSVFDELIVYQQRRVLEHARRLNGRVTADDIMNPIDVPELARDPQWNYEDGVLAGYRAAQTAIRARLRRPT